MKYKNLTIIGTSHIARQSLEEVKSAIEKIKPDIIAIELDRKRYYGLTHLQCNRSMGRKQAGQASRSKTWLRDDNCY